MNRDHQNNSRFDPLNFIILHSNSTSDNVKKVPGKKNKSASFCNCSRGWLMEIFETVLEEPVTVEMEDSIMKGGEQCRFSVYF